MIPAGATYRLDVIYTPDDPFAYSYYAEIRRLSDNELVTAVPGDTPDDVIRRARARVVELERPTPEYEPRTVYVDDAGEVVVEHSVKA
jgi:hypothetical protein